MRQTVQRTVSATTDVQDRKPGRGARFFVVFGGKPINCAERDTWAAETLDKEIGQG